MKIINQKFKKATCITDLHESILLNILFFLPATFIIRCRCVCKDWANLICQPFFPPEYLSRGQAPVQLVIQRISSPFLLQLHEAETDYYTTIINLNMQRIFRNRSPVNLYVVACHVTGWIVCFEYKNSRRTQLHIRYHMYNPLTGQHIVVAQPRRDGKEWHGNALVFAPKANQLKLLEFCKISDEQQEAHIQTIGTNKWRRIREVPCQHRDFFQPVLLNGRCHWFDIDKSIVHSFDVEEEVFEAVHETPCFGHELRPELGLLQGCLCLTTTNSHQTEVWVMKKYSIRDSWTRMFVFDDIPFVKILTCLENGKVLLLGDRVHYRENRYAMIKCYDPISEKCRHVGIRDEVKEVETRLPLPQRKKKTRKHRFRIRIFKFF